MLELRALVCARRSLSEPVTDVLKNPLAFPWQEAVGYIENSKRRIKLIKFARRCLHGQTRTYLHITLILYLSPTSIDHIFPLRVSSKPPALYLDRTLFLKGHSVCLRVDPHRGHTLNAQSRHGQRGSERFPIPVQGTHAV